MQRTRFFDLKETLSSESSWTKCLTPDEIFIIKNIIFRTWIWKANGHLVLSLFPSFSESPARNPSAVSRRSRRSYPTSWEKVWSQGFKGWSLTVEKLIVEEIVFKDKVSCQLFDFAVNYFWSPNFHESKVGKGVIFTNKALRKFF